MDEPTPLHGSCSCGRYHYVVTIPEHSTNEVQLYFVTDPENRRSTSSLLSSYLRIPLPWYSSRTLALFPDETHSSISKTFVPPHAPHSQRKFCGYCGTHLSYWTEEPPSEQDYVQINVGSLLGRDLVVLEQLGILDDTSDVDRAEERPMFTDLQEQPSDQGPVAGQDDSTTIAPTRSFKHGRIGDLSWFEEMIDGSRLGRTNKTRKGHGESADGSTSISWEVSEYIDGELDTPAETSTPAGTRAKRKIGEVTVDDDATMT